MEFRLPSLGEGIDSATVVNILVKPGDTITVGQAVLGVETDKASMEVESDVAGTVEAVLVKPNDKVPVGGAVLKLSGSAAAKPEPAKPAPAPAAAKEPAPAPAKEAAAPAAPAGKSDFSLPSLGEGIDAATVTSVLVNVGDTIKAGQAVIGVETDKASMEVEADVAGTIEAIHVKPGDKLNIGAKILSVTGGATATVPSGGSPAPAANGTKPKPAAASTPAGPAPAPVSANGSTKTKEKDLTPAGPATRRLARELGVALAEVKASGRGGRVTLTDVKEFVKTERERTKTGGGVAAVGGMIVNQFTLPPLPDFAKFGPIEKKPVANIRQTIAKNLTIGWRTMPMVTQHDLADITDLEAGRKRIVDALPKGAPKITMTVLAVKACVAALKEFAHFNSSFDMNAGELVVKKYFHIGIAVDTDRGLVVPVIRDADKKTIRDIAGEVVVLADKARSGKLSIDEMRGGTFTITNLGGIGGTAFTPIVNYPEVAILGLSRSALQPVVKDGQIVARLMMPMSLTYDHRVVDGADGARFTSRLAQLFSDPIRLLMES
jgi:pyruvate dehydrogenase E2 component (dihydrolipoamide acetyltransferase)